MKLKKRKAELINLANNARNPRRRRLQCGDEAKHMQCISWTKLKTRAVLRDTSRTHMFVQETNARALTDLLKEVYSLHLVPTRVMFDH